MSKLSGTSNQPAKYVSGYYKEPLQNLALSWKHSGIEAVQKNIAFATDKLFDTFTQKNSLGGQIDEWI